MKILNKKPFILGLGAIFCLSFLFVYTIPAKALDMKIRQVRTSENPAVYFLYHAGHRKKVYLNGDIYLDYGNKWPDVKVISSLELNSWPDIKLIKRADSPIVYFIRGNKKAVINTWADLEKFNLTREPILNVSQKELNYYQTQSYEEIGLVNSSVSNPVATTTPITNPTTPVVATSTPIVQSGTLLISSELVKGVNNNTILTNSDSNLMGIFHFRSVDKITSLKSVTFDFTGIYSDTFLRNSKVLDENGTEYNASFNFSQSRKQLTISFRDPLTLSPGSEKTMKIYLDAGTASDNQTIKVELKQATNVNSNTIPTATFPLKGTEFKVLNATNLLGQISSQEESVAASQVVSTGNRLIGKFTLSETSGKEDVLINKLVFFNSGTASKNDWEDFRLFSNGQIISRTSAVAEDGSITFNISYLRITKGKPNALTIFAALKSARNKTATVNIQLQTLVSTGKTYNISIQPEINNIEEKFIVN